ncbi:hypothetical protein [Halostagnicola kamekurae]|uniref:Uncharacterized protein n=1 Tax=Halostagnicola kamekurae TaxID=619731 RepID=A0A1I6PG08_9EURY|nr:hypothetical protein [Halostagnicola kamekurae]SFS39134.1 hypothetical protein SAMN04488556_0530 [Halostagnicola kamekurae]
MNRRQYLSTAGGLAVVSSLAGCLGDVLGSEDGEQLPDDHRDEARAINRAVGKLNKAAISIEGAESGLENPTEADFSADEPRSFIDAARSELESVEDSAIAAELASYADVLEAMIAVLETLTDDSLAADVEAISGEMAGGDTSTVEDTLETHRESIDGARENYDGAVATLENLDRDRLEEHSVVDLDRVESGIETIGNVLGSVESILSGYDSMLAGHESLGEGEERFDGGEYERAATAFESAADSFGDATETFAGEASDAPSGLAEYAETAHCQSGHLETAATEFAEGATAADNANIADAQQSQSDGEDALEAAENC